MDVKLKVIAGSNAGQELRITGPKFFIGRAEDCQLRPRSDLISRHHCVLIVEEKMVTVRDFGSRNGTCVNGERVGSERELKDGDLLKVGPLEFTVAMVERVVSTKRPPVKSIKEAVARTASADFDMDKDVSNWLNDEEQVLGESDTRAVNAHETEEVVMEDTTIEPGKKSQEPGKPAEKKAPGKLPPRQLVSGSDSFSAAADMLKKLRKR